MPKKLVIFKRIEVKGTIKKIPLRNVTVSDSFVGIGKKGQTVHSEFQRLAEDLEPGFIGIGIDVISI